MKQTIIIVFILTFSFSFSQTENKEQALAAKKASNFVYKGNEMVENEDFVSAEMEYRKAISKQSTTVAGAYNLGTTYLRKGHLEEAFYRLDQAVKTANSKTEKHKAFHNMGNILMQNKKCKEAVEVYKNALRNNPSDDETRYNLSVAKKCAEQQEKENKKDKDKKNKDDKEKQDDNKDDSDNKNKDKEDKEDKKEKGDSDNKNKDKEDKEDKKEKGDKENKKDEDDKNEEEKPKNEKKDKEKKGGDDKKEEQKQQPREGQLSPQQIKNLLEAMNNQEQKVQEKINAKKQKGVKIKTDKDW